MSYVLVVSDPQKIKEFEKSFSFQLKILGIEDAEISKLLSSLITKIEENLPDPETLYLITEEQYRISKKSGNWPTEQVPGFICSDSKNPPLSWEDIEKAHQRIPFPTPFEEN